MLILYFYIYIVRDIFIWCAFGIVNIDIFSIYLSNFKKFNFNLKLYASYFAIEGVVLIFFQWDGYLYCSF
jgi:hypothetical protein